MLDLVRLKAIKTNFSFLGITDDTRSVMKVTIASRSADYPARTVPQEDHHFMAQ